MAIQSGYNSTDFGLSSIDAYTKISSFFVDNIEPKRIIISTETFYDTNARLSGKKPIGSNTYIMEFAETFTFADMYNFIKEQSEFTGAIDI